MCVNFCIFENAQYILGGPVGVQGFWLHAVQAGESKFQCSGLYRLVSMVKDDTCISS